MELRERAQIAINELAGKVKKRNEIAIDHKNDFVESYIEKYLASTGLDISEVVLCHKFDGMLHTVWLEKNEKTT